MSRHSLPDKEGKCTKCGKLLEFGNDWTDEWTRDCAVPDNKTNQFYCPCCGQELK